MLASIEVRKEEIEKEYFERIEKEEEIDTTLSFPSDKRGHAHPLSLTSTILEEIFISMGFKIADGPHIEKEEYNFDKLNIPDNHPARDVWDTFWM
jgi:phenylalanyl-tRNA synthetase alpha chain